MSNYLFVNNYTQIQIIVLALNIITTFITIHSKDIARAIKTYVFTLLIHIKFVELIKLEKILVATGHIMQVLTCVKIMCEALSNKHRY